MENSIPLSGRPIGSNPSRRRMRVAFVTETYPPEVNGVSLTVARTIEGLRRRGHAIHLIRPRQSPEDAPLRGERLDETLVRGLPIPKYPHLKMGLPAGTVLDALWSATRPDVVHIATEGPLGWSALRAATRLDLPVTTDFRTNFHAYSLHYGIGWLRSPILRYLRSFHNSARVTMVPTGALMEELTAFGFRDVTVVSRGVDTVLFDPARRDPGLRASWGADADTLVVCCVGRLASEKNLGALLEAYAAIRRRDGRARLLLVGDGPMQAELRQRVPDAIHAGRRSGVDLAAHYASADLFLFPSLTETFGNVVLEAMASGLPVVAFHHAGAGQSIDSGRNGVLVRGHERAAFVATSCDVSADRESRVVLGMRARERALLQGWDRVDELFESVLARFAEEVRTGRSFTSAVVAAM